MKKYILILAVILTAFSTHAQGLSHAKKKISGKNKKDLFIHFTKYIEINDELRADSVSAAILKTDSSAEMKYKLSLYTKWARYYNMVWLDSAMSRIDKSDSAKKQMGQHYNSLAWYSLLTNQVGKARYYLDKSIQYDPTSISYNVNYPHVLLFNGKYAKARALYLKYKDLPFDHDYPKYKDVFLEDFKEFEKAGLNNKHLEEIAVLLNN